MAALQTETLTYFFDKSSGDIVHAHPDVTLYPPSPLLASSYFLTASGTPYDPTTGRHLDLPGNAIAVHPDGRRLYVAQDDCAVLEWSLETPSTLRALPAQTQSRCTTPGFPHGEVTAKGDRLVSPWGIWNLTTGRILPSPFLATSVVDPAVSPGARYVAHLIDNPRATDLTDMYLLQLYELATATVSTASSPVGVQSNSASLAFLDDPLRLCITNYGREVFLVPSLEHVDPAALAPDPYDPRPTCNLAAHTPKADHPELRQRLAAKGCALGDVLLPRSVCGAG